MLNEYIQVVFLSTSNIVSMLFFHNLFKKLLEASRSIDDRRKEKEKRKRKDLCEQLPIEMMSLSVDFFPFLNLKSPWKMLKKWR